MNPIQRALARTLCLTLCLTLFALPAQAQETTLTILEGGRPLWEDEFKRAHPGVRVKHVSVPAQGDAFKALLMTNEEYDVYELAIGPVYAALRDKGYLLPLTGATQAARFADAAFPYLRDALSQSGNVYAVVCPAEEDESQSVYLDAWSRDDQGWAEENLGEVPTTWARLLDMMIDWAKNREDSAYRLCDAPMEGEGFYVTLFQSYVSQYERADAPITFDTPAFREAMTLLKQYAQLAQPLDTRPALLSPFGGALTGARENGMVGMAPPTFEAGQTPVIQADFRVYVVNARTKHPAEALAYVETAARQYDEVSLLLMTPGAAKEIRFGNAVLVTREDAERTLALLHNAKINLSSLFLGGDHHFDMVDMARQYLQGALTLDLLVEKLDSRAALAFRENQQ